MDKYEMRCSISRKGNCWAVTRKLSNFPRERGDLDLNSSTPADVRGGRRMLQTMALRRFATRHGSLSVQPVPGKYAIGEERDEGRHCAA